MGIVLKNNTKSTLSAAISSTDTTLPITDTSGFPALGVGDYFYATIESTTGAYEIVKVTQVNNTTFLATRAQEDTIAIPFNSGARIELRITVQTLEDQFGVGVAAAAEDYLDTQIGVTIQAYDADLTTWAGLTPSANFQTLVPQSFAQMRGSLDLEAGTDFYSISATDAAIAAAVSAIGAVVVLKGTWDASAGTFPGAGIAQAGWSYIVSVGGTVNGEVFVANDRIVATANNASTTTYASNWHKLDYTDAVQSVAGKTGAVTLQVADITDMTANGRSLTSAADYAAMRALLDLEVGTDFLSPAAIAAAYQPLDADLTTWAGLTPSANAQSLVTAANYAAMRTLLDLEAGTDFYSISATNSAIAAVISDDVYGAGWNGATTIAPSKNAVYDKIEALSAGSLSDGDKGDITVSASGATWTIDAGVVTYAKMQDVSATSRVLGRITGGSGDVEELTAANVKTILALAQADITGLTTADTPTFTGINVANTDTTLTRLAAGNVGIEGKSAARVTSGTAANSGLISWGTAAPGTLAEGEIYLRYA